VTADCRRIQALVMTIQNDYLDNPALRLTLARAQARFGVDALTGEAVLGALVDARVLARTPDGAYVRFLPRSAGRTTPRRTSEPGPARDGATRHWETRPEAHHGTCWMRKLRSRSTTCSSNASVRVSGRPA
jgi:hypothetical protein